MKNLERFLPFSPLPVDSLPSLFATHLIRFSATPEGKLILPSENEEIGALLEEANLVPLVELGLSDKLWAISFSS